MEENNFIYQIFCDMDGVLVDFEDAAVNKINEALSKENPPMKKLADRVKKDLGREDIGDRFADNLEEFKDECVHNIGTNALIERFEY